MTPEEVQKLFVQKQQSQGQRYADAPKAPDFVSDPMLGGMRSSYSDKLKQLFEYDTQMAQTYFQPQEAPGPHAPGYQPPEQMVLDPMIGAKARSIQQQGTVGELGDIWKDITTRKDEMETAYEKGLRLYQLGLEAQKEELGALKDLFNMATAIEELDLSKRRLSQSESNKATDSSNLAAFKKLITEGDGKDTVPDQIHKAGKTKAKGQKALSDMNAVLQKIRQSSPDAELTYTKNKDGSYNYRVFTKTYNTRLLNDWLASFVATNPDLRSEAESIFSYVYPEEKTQSLTEGDKKRAVIQGVYQLKQEGKTAEELEDYIRKNGYDPLSPEFITIL